MSLGTVLRNARESKGLTIEQVTEQTRLIRQIVEDLEHDDFHRIVATVYGCGFIKLYAECVGVDPAPLQQEFKEVYSGFRRPNIQTRAVNTPAERPAAPAHPAVPTPPKVRAVPLEEKPTPPKVRTVPLEEKPTPPAREIPAADPAPAKTAANSATSAVAAFFASREKEAVPVQKAEPVAEKTEVVSNVREEPPAQPVSMPETKAAEIEPVSDPLPVVTEEKTPAADVVETPQTEPVLNEAESVAEPEPVSEEPVPEPAASADEDLGELFAVSSRPAVKEKPSASVAVPPQTSEPSKEQESAKAVEAEHHLKMPVTTQAPSWDDKPFREPLPSWMQYVKVKIVAAVLAGLVILGIAIFGIALACRPKPPADDNGEQVVSAPVENVAPAMTDGASLFSEKVLPPSDCYVD